MKTKPLSLLFTLILGLIPLVEVSQVRSEEQNPNIVVFLCDDLGYGDLGCYGHPKIKTPNLDQLADSGIRFTNFYSAAPVCSPSRVGLLTGRSPNKAGVFDWIPSSNGSPKKNGREQVHMRKGEVTIAKLLKKSGYETLLAGKWHCNSQFNTKAQPQPGDFGFDHWFTTQNNALPSHENPKNYVRNGTPVGELKGYSCQLVVDEAIQWLEGRTMKKSDEDNSSEEDKPFFMYLPFHEPHEPVASPKELVEKYLPVAKNRDQAQYFANVENVDRAVGRLIAALNEKKIRENTLIIFTSDNGPETLNRYRRANRSYGNPGELRGMKLHTHDAGFRVAGIVNWKGQIEAKQVSDQVVSSLDFLPTFCKLAKVSVPETLNVDGTDFMPATKGKSIGRRKPLVWCYYNAINQARVAMRDGKLKVLAQLMTAEDPKKNLKRMDNLTEADRAVVANAKLAKFEIYDVTQDISETKNLYNPDSATSQILVAKLKDEYKKLVSDYHFWNDQSEKKK